MAGSSLMPLLSLPLLDTIESGSHRFFSGQCTNFSALHVASKPSSAFHVTVGSFRCRGLTTSELGSVGRFEATFSHSRVNASIGGLGVDTDEHGCKASAGYSWCAEHQQCIRPWETACADEARHLARCDARVALQSLLLYGADGHAHTAVPSLHNALEQHVNKAACAVLSPHPTTAIPLLADALPALNSGGGDGQMRLGAELAFSALGVLVMASLATLACFCRQRELERRTRRNRYASLLRQYANDEWAGDGLSGGGPNGTGLRDASQRLLPPTTAGVAAAAAPMLPRDDSRESLRREVSTLALAQRAAVANTWWRVVAAWMATVSAAVFHALLAGRLGLLSLDASEAESPGTDDIAILLVWASNAPPVAGHTDPSTGHSPVLALPLPVGEPLFGGEGVGALDASVRYVLYLLSACALTPLFSLLLLLVVLPWTPPDLEAPTWLWLRRRVLALIEMIGIWSMLPVGVALGFSATLQTKIELPAAPLTDISSMHIELALGCSLSLYTAAALLTLAAVNRAAIASTPPPTAPTNATAAGVPAAAAANSLHNPNSRTANGSCSSLAPLAVPSSGSFASLPPIAARVATLVARRGESPATITRKRFTIGTVLHAAALILIFVALPLPAIKLDAPTIVAHSSRLPTPIGARHLSLIGIVVGAMGTGVPSDAPVRVHGAWMHAANLCGLTRPPPSLLAATALLLALVLPPAWRMLRALTVARGAADFRGGGERLAAWHLADVLVAALLSEIALLPAVGQPLINSQMGGALRRFADVSAIEWTATWGQGAWMLLAAALCDAAGRLVTG